MDLEKQEFEKFQFFDLESESIWKMLAVISVFPMAHLHTSSSFLQFIIALYCKLLNTKLIITYHGNLGRFGAFKNLLTGLSVWLSHTTVVLNSSSLKMATKWNSNSILISAFIRPFNVVPLRQDILQNVLGIKSKYKYMFCTNAGNVTFDKNGHEIYGISDLISVFEEMAKSCLIISDPTGNYQKYIRMKRKVPLPENILFITYYHDFCGILELSDAFIRNTTTDGDSISIREALFYHTVAFASDCVPRPMGCRLYNDIFRMDFENKLEEALKNPEEKYQDTNSEDTTGKLISIYNGLAIR